MEHVSILQNYGGAKLLIYNKTNSNGHFVLHGFVKSVVADRNQNITIMHTVVCSIEVTVTHCSTKVLLL